MPDSGAVTLRGKAAPKSTILKGPVTGRPCVYYSLEVFEWQNGSRAPLLHEQSDASFKLEDQGGSVLVDGRGAECELPLHRLRAHMSFRPAYPDALRKVLALHGFGMTDEYGELRSLEFREALIVPGDEIDAQGTLRRDVDPGGEASYRELPRRLVLGSSAESPLFLRGDT